MDDITFTEWLANSRTKDQALELLEDHLLDIERHRERLAQQARCSGSTDQLKEAKNEGAIQIIRAIRNIIRESRGERK